MGLPSAVAKAVNRRALGNSWSDPSGGMLGVNPSALYRQPINSNPPGAPPSWAQPSSTFGGSYGQLQDNPMAMSRSTPAAGLPQAQKQQQAFAPRMPNQLAPTVHDMGMGMGRALMGNQLGGYLNYGKQIQGAMAQMYAQNNMNANRVNAARQAAMGYGLQNKALDLKYQTGLNQNNLTDALSKGSNNLDWMKHSDMAGLQGRRLDIDSQQGSWENDINRGQLQLDRDLGLGNLGVQRELGLGGLGIKNRLVDALSGSGTIPTPEEGIPGWASGGNVQTPSIDTTPGTVWPGLQFQGRGAAMPQGSSATGVMGNMWNDMTQANNAAVGVGHNLMGTGEEAKHQLASHQAAANVDDQSQQLWSRQWQDRLAKAYGRNRNLTGALTRV